jgi:transposase
MDTIADHLDHLSREELLALVRTQELRIRDLEGRVAELTAEIDRLLREGKRQAAPFSKGKRKANPKRPGRKPGQGVFRHRTAPDPSQLTEPPIPVPVQETACPDCGGALGPEQEERAWTTELPTLPRPEVREYRIQRSRCRGCGRQVRGRHPAVAEDQRGATAHRLGPRLVATAHQLHYGLGIPVRKLPALFREITGVELTQSALTQAALRQAKRSALAAADQVRHEAAQAPAIHVDPTGWRVQGESAQLAVYVTRHAALYQITPRFRNDEVLDVIGKSYPGVLITDRGRAYDARSLELVRQQKCLVHVLRNLAEVLEKKPGPARRFTTTLSRLLRRALRLERRHRSGRLTGELYGRLAERLEQKITHQLRDRVLRDRDNQRLLSELGRHHDRGNLVRFLSEPDLPATNNAAERALRPAVIARKVSQCSKSWAAALARAAYLTLIATAQRRHVRSPVDALMYALQTGQPPPVPA